MEFDDPPLAAAQLRCWLDIEGDVRAPSRNRLQNAAVPPTAQASTHSEKPVQRKRNAETGGAALFLFLPIPFFFFFKSLQKKTLQVCAPASVRLRLCVCVCARASESEGSLSCCCFTALIRADR